MSKNNFQLEIDDYCFYSTNDENDTYLTLATSRGEDILFLDANAVEKLGHFCIMMKDVLGLREFTKSFKAKEEATKVDLLEIEKELNQIFDAESQT